MHDSSQEALHRSTARRAVTAAFGVVFIGLGLAILVAVEPLHLGAAGAALVLALLGGDACMGAWRGKQYLMWRIGPLP
ncbi:MAG: hypothetical protein ACK515_26630 [bacterium]|jgi:hypothetical protein|nr:hypothetical protein [Betaproteobacteria bacterium]